MDYKQLSRPLEISDVDFRVQSINNGGYATILAYKDARVDMNRLDEVLTPLGWQRDYKLIDGKLFCGVGIWHFDSGQWVWKWDVGTESNTEAEKGQASDAFKRACFNLGIGRELYDYPVISVKLLEKEWTKENGKPRQTYELKIKDWKWYSEFTDGKISFLAAKDQDGNVRFKWGQMKPKDKDVEPTYKAASGGAPAVDEGIKSQPLSSPEPEMGNVAGILKKPSVEDESRDAAISEYESVFGKKPHGKMSTANIISATQEEINRIASEEMTEEEELLVDETHEEEEEEINTEPSILDHISQIQDFTDAATFVSWAKLTVSEYQDASKEDLDTFKDLCNNHYSKIVK